MKAYDPRLDTSPGEHRDDPAFSVETNNPALIFGRYAFGIFDRDAWEALGRWADYCEEPVGEAS